MPPKTKEQSWVELKKEYKTRFSTLAIIIWGAYSKYYERQRHPGSLKKGKKTDKGLTTENLLQDVKEFFESLEDQITIKTEEQINNLTCDPRNQEHVLAFIKAKSGNIIKPKAFSDLRSFFDDELINIDPESEIPIEIPREHLELLCIYGFNLTYQQLLEVYNSCIFWNQKIRWIQLNLDKLFKPTVQSFLAGLQKMDTTCSSKVVKEWVCDMLDKETVHINDALSKGFFPVNHRFYFEELTSLMKRCSRGFGVNITKWNRHWDETAGKNLLQINKDQHMGLAGVHAFDYIRIFLVDGAGNDILNEKELEIIKAQLDSFVTVYVVTKSAWAEFENDIDLFDFAVLRVDDAPLLLRSKFDDGKTSGIFYTDMYRPKMEYDASLQKVLVHDKGNHIYMPRLQGKSKVIIGAPIGPSGITDLTDKLLSIYTHKNLSS